MPTSPDIVICGAGIAGIALAYQLAVQHALTNVLLVDERPPLSLTSDKSTEAYRNYWPGPDGDMRRLMDRSIDLLEGLAAESNNRFLLNRRGYLYATADPARATQLEEQARAATRELRIHRAGQDQYHPPAAEGFLTEPDGADLLLGPDVIQRHFPYLSPQTVAALHTRRCGWFSGQQLGMHLLEQARARGVTLQRARVTGVDCNGGRVSGVRLATSNDTQQVATGAFVNAAGPLVVEVGRMLDLELPIFCERHLKASFKDHLGVVPRNAPLLIWEDAQRLAWSDDEKAWLAESAETSWLLDQFPPGVHMRPEGGGESQNILLLWAYHTEPVEPAFPIPEEPEFPELVMRGMSAMIPGLSSYIGALPRPWVDGGYYTKTRENRLLACPLPIDGAYLLGALSGYGLMGALGAGELVAGHIAGRPLPHYAAAFDLQRYQDPDYVRQIESWSGSLQL